MKKIAKILIIFLALCVILTLTYVVYEHRREKAAILFYSDTITEYSFKYNIDANLVLAVIKAESNFKENAVSHKGAIGLMQIMPLTSKFIATELGEEIDGNSLFAYQTNIKYGVFYLSYLYKKFNNLESILAAYNAGEGNVNAWLKKYSDDGISLNFIPFAETQKYVTKVKDYYSRYKQNYNY